MLQMGMERFSWLEMILEDGMKLEPWIFKRMDQDLGEILLQSSKLRMMKRTTTKIIETLQNNEEYKYWSKYEKNLKAILEKAYDW